MICSTCDQSFDDRSVKVWQNKLVCPSCFAVLASSNQQPDLARIERLLNILMPAEPCPGAALSESEFMQGFKSVDPAAADVALASLYKLYRIGLGIAEKLNNHGRKEFRYQVRAALSAGTGDFLAAVNAVDLPRLGHFQSLAQEAESMGVVISADHLRAAVNHLLGEGGEELAEEPKALMEEIGYRQLKGRQPELTEDQARSIARNFLSTKRQAWQMTMQRRK